MSLFPASLAGISVTNSAGTFKAQGFDGNEIARIYDGSSSFSRSAAGTQIVSGPTFRQKYIWAIACKCTETEALLLDTIFQAWDASRADGASAVVNVVDETFGPNVATTAVFSTPPSFTRSSNGGNIYSVSFGLTEV